MAAPVKIRSNAGFRNLMLLELNSSGLPIGTVTREQVMPYYTAGSVIVSGSVPVTLAAGAAVSGSVPYYGKTFSGAKVFSITDPTPRIINHTGDDTVISLQVLPALEAMNGEVRGDKTDDIIDAMLGALNSFTIGEANFLGEGTNKRGFENLVGAIAYNAAQDTDPFDSAFGATIWDFRIIPKLNMFLREQGYTAEATERLYTAVPMFVTSHIWGVAFSNAIEGFLRGQMLRGVSQYKPKLVSWLGDGATAGFPFDSNFPAASTNKIHIITVNGVASGSANWTKNTYGINFNVAPGSGSVVTAFYESL